MTHDEWLEACPLRRWRKQQSPPWSRGKLAEAAGIARMTIYYWEHGKFMPRIDTWELVQYVTHVTPRQYTQWFKEKPEGTSDKKETPE